MNLYKKVLFLLVSIGLLAGCKRNALHAKITPAAKPAQGENTGNKPNGGDGPVTSPGSTGPNSNDNSPNSSVPSTPQEIADTQEIGSTNKVSCDQYKAEELQQLEALSLAHEWTNEQYQKILGLMVQKNSSPYTVYAQKVGDKLNLRLDADNTLILDQWEDSDSGAVAILDSAQVIKTELKSGSAINRYTIEVHSEGTSEIIRLVITNDRYVITQNEDDSIETKDLTTIWEVQMIQTDWTSGYYEFAFAQSFEKGEASNWAELALKNYKSLFTKAQNLYACTNSQFEVGNSLDINAAKIKLLEEVVALRDNQQFNFTTTAQALAAIYYAERILLEGEYESAKSYKDILEMNQPNMN